jgi:FixJ family two-component response regulator
MDILLPWVAVVDDEEAIRRALLRLMRSAGITARAYACGADFLDALAGDHPCCVILDVNMPGLSGLDVMARLAVDAPAIGVVIMTGNHTLEEQARALQHRPLAYLPKPVNDQLLLNAIAAVCTPGRQP